MERVLIIEDDELIAELERDYLEANGYETKLAFDGETGERLAKTEHFDTILFYGYFHCRNIYGQFSG